MTPAAGMGGLWVFGVARGEGDARSSGGADFIDPGESGGAARMVGVLNLAVFLGQSGGRSRTRK